VRLVGYHCVINLSLNGPEYARLCLPHAELMARRIEAAADDLAFTERREIALALARLLERDCAGLVDLQRIDVIGIYLPLLQCDADAVATAVGALHDVIARGSEEEPGFAVAVCQRLAEGGVEGVLNELMDSDIGRYTELLSFRNDILACLHRGL